ncbi:MAG: polysaccharide deacetylase [Eubacterium sp.]|nr:polysaccharide deacetylase [Eubacterium sp.]
MSIRMYYPGGREKALTFSYDDGQIFDRTLVGIFNKYKMKATFHLNSGTLGKEGFITEQEVTELFRGHEISCHSVTHPFLNQLPQGQLINEIWEDRRNLERLAGYPVRGMSYPFGVYDERSLKVSETLGIEYSRTVNATNSFSVPGNFLEWHPTCHHNDNILGKLDSFKNQPPWSSLPLFYIWGHSFEFHRQNNWEIIEVFCSEASGDPNVWYATNIEIKDYIYAVRKLIFNVEQTQVYNPSAITVWLGRNGNILELNPGQTLQL